MVRDSVAAPSGTAAVALPCFLALRACDAFLHTRQNNAAGEGVLEHKRMQNLAQLKEHITSICVFLIFLVPQISGLIKI